MNTLDIIILILVLISALLGLRKGFLKSILSLAGIITGLFIATRYNDRVTEYLGFLKIEPKLLSLISFITIIVLFYFLANYIARKISHFNTVTKTVDRLLGTATGIFKGLIIASLFLLLTTNTFSFFKKEDVEKSKFYTSVVNIAPEVYNYVIKIFPDAKNFYDEMSNLIFNS